LTSNEIGCGGFSVQIIIKGGRRRHAIVGGVIQKKKGRRGRKNGRNWSGLYVVARISVHKNKKITQKTLSPG
jgi:hypothetical protein